MGLGHGMGIQMGHDGRFYASMGGHTMTAGVLYQQREGGATRLSRSGAKYA